MLGDATRFPLRFGTLYFSKITNIGWAIIIAASIYFVWAEFESDNQSFIKFSSCFKKMDIEVQISVILVRKCPKLS